MSFEIYVQCFDRGVPAGIPREAVRSQFPLDESKSDESYWAVAYDEFNTCHIGVTPLESDSRLVHAICVHRPCGDQRLLSALLDIMGFGSVVLYFPGDSPPLVASEAAAQHLPVDMLEALGAPRVVRSPNEIAEAIKKG